MLILTLLGWLVSRLAERRWDKGRVTPAPAPAPKPQLNYRNCGRGKGWSGKYNDIF